jgi:hypothetical protein
MSTPKCCHLQVLLAESTSLRRVRVCAQVIDDIARQPSDRCALPEGGVGRFSVQGQAVRDVLDRHTEQDIDGRQQPREEGQPGTGVGGAG